MDKSIFKAAGIIAIVIGAFYTITIFGAIIGIPLIIGGSLFIDYSKLSDKEIKEKKGSILGWSIFFILFSFIPGVLGIVGYILFFENSAKPKEPTLKNKIVELDEMKEEGLLTAAEYKKRKAKVLEED